MKVKCLFVSHGETWLTLGLTVASSRRDLQCGPLAPLLDWLRDRIKSPGPQDKEIWNLFAPYLD